MCDRARTPCRYCKAANRLTVNVQGIMSLFFTGQLNNKKISMRLTQQIEQLSLYRLPGIFGAQRDQKTRIEPVV